MKGVDSWERVTWPRVSYFEMITPSKALDASKFGSSVAQFGNRKHAHRVRCLLNSTLMIQGLNTTGIIVEEMKLADAAMSL
jgi:hypothetical protein